MIGILFKKLRTFAFGPTIYKIINKMVAVQTYMANASNSLTKRRNEEAHQLLSVHTSTLIYSQNSSFLIVLFRAHRVLNRNVECVSENKHKREM